MPQQFFIMKINKEMPSYLDCIWWFDHVFLVYEKFSTLR